MSVYKNQNAYVVSTGSFLPGKPIPNDEMENVLGLVNGKKSRYRSRILRSNGIKSRHYALDENGRVTHLTDQLASESIAKALANLSVDADTLDMIAVGTTLPDLLAPGIASMVHGRVGGGNTDILSTSGICGAGAAALKASALSVISGQHNRVASCGVDRASVLMQGHRFEEESNIQRDSEEDICGSYHYFNADFLRWMLSDGAGAFIIDNQPNEAGISLKVEWIETASYANKLDTCMYMGCSNPQEMKPDNTWLGQGNEKSLDTQGLLLLRQDTTLLGEHIVDIVVDYVIQLKEKYGLPEIDWFLPHISSFFFREKLQETLSSRGVNIPSDRWFTNLKEKGNTGAASIYIMLDELFNSGRLSQGQKILLMIPESGRFSVTYALLTVEERS